ncbi:MAG: hypothetical protein R3F10_06970 [Lysobacteraceae bacterium]
MIPSISPPIRTELSPSRWLRWAVLVLAMLAVFALGASRLPEYSKLLVIPFALWAWWQLARQGRVRLVFGEDGRAIELNADGSDHVIEPIALHERGPLGVLVFSRMGKVRRVPFASDVIDADARRRLRLWMRRHVPEASAPWFSTDVPMVRSPHPSLSPAKGEGLSGG